MLWLRGCSTPGSNSTLPTTHADKQHELLSLISTTWYDSKYLSWECPWSEFKRIHVEFRRIAWARAHSSQCRLCVVPSQLRQKLVLSKSCRRHPSIIGLVKNDKWTLVNIGPRTKDRTDASFVLLKHRVWKESQWKLIMNQYCGSPQKWVQSTFIKGQGI